MKAQIFYKLKKLQDSYVLDFRVRIGATYHGVSLAITKYMAEKIVTSEISTQRYIEDILAIIINNSKVSKNSLHTRRNYYKKKKIAKLLQHAFNDLLGIG